MTLLLYNHYRLTKIPSQMRSFFSVGHKALCALLTTAALLFMGGWAQAQTTSGKVIDTNGVPVIGAAVMVPGTTTGVTTDIDGNFELRVAPGTQLEVSCIGYVTKRVSAAANMTVTLEEDAEMLEETVVIGYGSVKRSDLTSAVAKMDNKGIEDRPMARAEQALQGQLAGVSVRITSSEPGADPEIRVRGAASISAGNNPLYVIDGIPQESMTGLNPNDIASIEVLKDAASSAIYGSRGSNGVVIVTTKTGQKGKPKVTYTGTVGLSTLEKKMDSMSAVEWMEFAVRCMDAMYLQSYPQGSISDDNATRMANLRISAPRRTGGNAVNFDDRWFKYLSPEMQASHTYHDDGSELSLLDWQSHAYKPAWQQSHNISISGANDATKYMFSLGYMDQDGLSPASNYKRINLRTNVESKLNNWITVGLNIAPSFVINYGAGRGNGKDTRAHHVLSSPPVSDTGVGYNVDYYPNSTYLWGGTGMRNLASYDEEAPVNHTLRMQASSFLRVNPFDGFQIEATASANYLNSNTHRFVAKTMWYDKKALWLQQEGINSSVTHNTDYAINTLLQVVANYNKTFGKHSIAAMLGASSEVGNIGYATNQSYSNLANDVIQGTFKGSNATTTPTVKASDLTEKTHTKLLSAFARINYNYDNRYMFSASLRRDGYSRFGSQSKWGWFPSASAGWMISNEPFFKNADLGWWNTFKLRISYGQTGNYGIGEAAAYSTLVAGDYGGNLAYYAGSFGNIGLGWEKTHSTDVAVDLGFLNNRIQLSVDWYTKTTTDLLYNVPVPSVFGTTSITDNLGSVLNHGLEIELNTQNISGRDFTWSTSFNVSYNRNKVLQLGDNTKVGDYVITGSNMQMNQILRIGSPMYEFYELKYLGVWKNQAEIDAATAAHPEHKVPSYKGTPVVPGDPKYEDVDGDNNVNDDARDWQVVGQPAPKFVFGMTNRFTWKNFDASILFTAQTGGQILGGFGRAIDRPHMGTQQNTLRHWLKDAWWSENEPGNGLPYPLTTKESNVDSRFVYSSDYFRIKNLTIGYKIPFKNFIESARVYLSIENLLILDSYYLGYTPEAANQSGFVGVDYGAYPSARTFTLGVNINF